MGFKQGRAVPFVGYLQKELLIWFTAFESYSY